MNKVGKRFIAMFVVFTSIVSFLPMKFGENGQAVNAAAVSVTDIRVSGEALTSGDKVTASNDVYTTENMFEYFTITVPNKTYTGTIEAGKTEIINQEIIIKSINGIKLEGTLDEKNEALKKIGSSITEGTIKFDNDKYIGARINGLPFGVNKIEYQIKETTQENKKIEDATNPNGYREELQAPVTSVYPSEQQNKKITIQHGKKYVQDKIESLKFNSYIGKKSNYDENSENNKPTFLFTNIATADPDMPLSYTFDVPDGTDTLEYVMTFKDAVEGATVFKNGVEDTATITDNTVEGYLANLGQTDLIVIRINALEGGSSTPVQKSYAIEIKYNTLEVNEDFTLRDAGITKLNYDSASDVKAYIGKKFTQVNNSSVLTYEGEITIDKRAEMISMEPTLGRSSSSTAFVISNHYDNGQGISNSKQVNGKQYVDFKKGTNNEIWLDIYAGKDGNTEGSILARYKLKVKLIDTAPESNGLKIDFGDNAYLTQPGRKDDKISFNIDRRTYDLYSGDDVDVTLVTPQTSKKEYLKVWLGNSTDNDVVTEVENVDKSNTLNVDVSKAKRMVVQAYYDEITYDTAGNEIREPKALGYKYVFYIAKNADTPEEPGNGDSDADNASLSGLKFNNGTLKSTDGTSGFLSNTYNYNLTVPKADTVTKITATTEDKKAKSIILTVTDTSDEYELTSGESFEIPLNSTGTTNLKIVVTAADGVTKKTYNVTVKNDERNSSAKLRNVFLNVGDFDFDPEEDTTKVRVDQDVTSIRVTPVPEDSKARVTVNGEKFNGSPVTVSLKGSQETDITIKVTSEDGNTTEKYTLEVYRSDSDLDFDDDDDDDDDDEDIFYDEFDETWVDLSKYEEWGKVDGKLAYFNNKGRQVKNSWINTNGNYYYLGSKGFKETGWRTESDGKRYYLDPSTGEMRKGWINQNNTWYYLGLNGVMKTGWLYLNNKWYYFTPDGELIANQSMYIDGQIYRFAQDGTMY